MKKQGQDKRWWVSRDRAEADFYQIHRTNEKPVPRNKNVYSLSDVVILIKGDVFRKVFALSIRRGECLEIERPTLILKGARPPKIIKAEFRKATW